MALVAAADIDVICGVKLRPRPHIYSSAPACTGRSSSTQSRSAPESRRPSPRGTSCRIPLPGGASPAASGSAAIRFARASSFVFVFFSCCRRHDRAGPDGVVLSRVRRYDQDDEERPVVADAGELGSGLVSCPAPDPTEDPLVGAARLLCRHPPKPPFLPFLRLSGLQASSRWSPHRRPAA